MVIENVPEYSPTIPKKHLGAHWRQESVVIDPRIFGVAAGRPRVYILTWNTRRVVWTYEGTLTDLIDSLAARVIGSASDFWWMTLGPSKLTPAEARLTLSYHGLAMS